jgi:hypothetical protein
MDEFTFIEPGIDWRDVFIRGRRHTRLLVKKS